MADDPNDLIYEHVSFERRWMWFERACWLLLSLVLLAGCFGVFGRGAYARETMASGGLTVTYDRIVRARTQTDVDIVFDESVTRGGQVRVQLSGALFQKTPVFDVLPKPSQEQAFQKGAVYTFPALAGSPATVTITQKVEGIGRVQSHVGVEGGPTLSLSQIILP